mgnify:CR=1 FL=1
MIKNLKYGIWPIDDVLPFFHGHGRSEPYLREEVVCKKCKKAFLTSTYKLEKCEDHSGCDEAEKEKVCQTMMPSLKLRVYP